MFPAVPMPIRTPRLVIRPPQVGDGAPTAAAIAETWDDLHRWMLWAERREANTAELQEFRSRHVLNTFLLRQELNMVGVDRATGQMAIWTGFHDLDWTDRTCQVGYWVRRSRQGEGLATEAANALVRYAFEALAMRVVRISCAAGNEASRRVIEKLGFTLDFVEANSSQLPGGRVVDRLWYLRDTTSGMAALDVEWSGRVPA